jgi:hypothetical protein
MRHLVKAVFGLYRSDLHPLKQNVKTGIAHG